MEALVKDEETQRRMEELSERKKYLEKSYQELCSVWVEGGPSRSYVVSDTADSK